MEIRSDMCVFCFEILMCYEKIHICAIDDHWKCEENNGLKWNFQL